MHANSAIFSQLRKMLFGANKEKPLPPAKTSRQSLMLRDFGKFLTAAFFVLFNLKMKLSSNSFSSTTLFHYHLNSVLVSPAKSALTHSVPIFQIETERTKRIKCERKMD